MVTRCHSLYHSLSLVVIRCHSLYHSLSFDVIHCHSLSLDVPLVYLFINDSLAQQFTSKSSLNRVFILQKKCLRIITFSFYKDHSNPLFKNLKLLKLRDVLESEIIKFFYKFSRNELPKSVCSIFNLVHEVHTRNTRNNLLIYIPRMSTSRYGNHSLRSDGASLWNKFFKDFFPNHDLTSFLKLK